MATATTPVPPDPTSLAALREPSSDALRAHGYAPGNYTCLCVRCGKYFDGGDKRACKCKPCAVFQVANLEFPLVPSDLNALRERVEALEAALRPFARIGEMLLACKARGVKFGPNMPVMREAYFRAVVLLREGEGGGK